MLNIFIKLQSLNFEQTLKYLRTNNVPFSITHIRDLINDQRATLKNGATYIKYIFMKK